MRPSSPAFNGVVTGFYGLAVSRWLSMGLQKAANGVAKGGLSHDERPPFGS